ncbi:MAG TPA: hypothetical protein VHP58_02280 [Alphaproteobacteria bacterium]|nr:hypothetical protein [Alphaproteobacteria bacterium]
MVMLVGAGGALAGCQTTAGTTAGPMVADEGSPSVLVSRASMPKTVRPYQRVDSVLKCIAGTRQYRNSTFIVGNFVDSTGKFNAVSPGTSGAFLPKEGTSTFITAALRRAGAEVIPNYAVGSPNDPANIRYQVSGFFNTLDFGTPFQADLQVAGVGPTANSSWAQPTLTIQLDNFQTKRNIELSQIERPITYNQGGVGANRLVGATLVTGNIAVQDQQRLQFESVNGTIGLGVADVLMKHSPVAAAACRGQIADLLDPPQDVAEVQ